MANGAPSLPSLGDTAGGGWPIGTYPSGGQLYTAGGTPTGQSYGEDTGGGFMEFLLNNLGLLEGLGGGRGYTVPWSQTQPGVERVGEQQLEQIQLQNELAGQRDLDLTAAQGEIQKELERLRQKGQLTIADMQLKSQLERQMKQIAHERETLYIQMKGQDPVRAVMYGLQQAFGGARGDRKGDLAGMTRSLSGKRAKGARGRGGFKGAGKFERETEAALSGLLGGRTIDITAEEVGGLPTAEKAATSFMRGGEAERGVLGSAYGIGREGIGGGLSSEEFVRRIQDVTPTGVL